MKANEHRCRFPSNDTVERINACMNLAIERGIPGISVAIGARNGVIWTGTAGWADVRAKLPIDRRTLFGIGSITKTMVATVVLQLVEEGRLDLDDTPGGVLGLSATAGVANADCASVADLLGHRSGVPSWENDPRWIRAGRGRNLDPSRIWGRTEALEYVRATPPTDRPGGAFAYSNSNYTLLGLMVETVTQHGLQDEIRRRILQPVGLADTYLEGFEPGHPQRVAHRYHYATPEFRETAGIAPAFVEVEPGLVDTGGANLSVEWAAGGMISSPSDLVTFAVALRGGRLLGPSEPRVHAALDAWRRT